MNFSRQDDEKSWRLFLWFKLKKLKETKSIALSLIQSI